MKYAIFIPVRRGSERVEKKNTRDFSGIEGGLLAVKLNQLTNFQNQVEVIISTNDAESIEIAGKYKSEIENLKIIERPENLGTSSTPLKELIKYAGKISTAEHILWTHVTSPFCDKLEYEKALNLYEKMLRLGYDSLISGRNYKEFLLDKLSGKMVNKNTGFVWPRTQDLPDWFEINNGIFLTSRENFKAGMRTGSTPFLYTQGNIASLDVDYEEDFKIAEAVYDKLYR